MFTNEFLLVSSQSAANPGFDRQKEDRIRFSVSRKDAFDRKRPVAEPSRFSADSAVCWPY